MTCTEWQMENSQILWVGNWRMLLCCGKMSSETVVAITWEADHVLLRLTLRKSAGKNQNDSVCWPLLMLWASDYQKEMDINLPMWRWTSKSPLKNLEWLESESDGKSRNLGLFKVKKSISVPEIARDIHWKCISSETTSLPQASATLEPLDLHWQKVGCESCLVPKEGILSNVSCFRFGHTG